VNRFVDAFHLFLRYQSIIRRNMKTLLSLFFACSLQLAHSQYYYNDILGSRTLGARMKVYVDNKVKSVIAVGYDKQGVRTTDFNEWQEVDAAKMGLRMVSRNGQQVVRQYYQFDSQYRLTSITDSSSDIRSVTMYTYDQNNDITSIKTTTKDSLSDFNETEERRWFYTSAGKPASMWRVLNGKDSSEYRFTLDETGNVAEEQLYRRGVAAAAEPVYYYYDQQNRLTDIVRYNKRVKKLLADFMFEYDERNRVIQRITTLSTINPDYLIWRYLFDDKGLKTKEALFDKQKELTGRIEYQYTYSP
jgi:hypothetical protein